MQQRRIARIGAAFFLLPAVLVAACDGNREDPAQSAPPPVLSVAVTHARIAALPVRVPATGNIAAWQEASIGAEADGLRLVAVDADVGDTVRRGQVLARFSADIVRAELAEASAAVAQAAAQVDEAQSNAARARSLTHTGALSTQQIDQYVVAAATARARLEAMRAAERRQRLRVTQTRVVAPDDGIVTSRTATVGAVVPAGQELFRVIRDGRLEWRAAVAAADIGRLAPGQVATLDIEGREVRGRLRMIAPAIDTQTRTGLVYVDLPDDPAIRTGAFARGHVELGDAPALTVPQSAVLLRDGFRYVMRVGPASTVVMQKVSVGRRAGDRLEITEGLAASDAVIVSGLGFLADGDTVRIVDASATPAGSDS
jgi:RND family efflux transporter MFP subunit